MFAFLENMSSVLDRRLAEHHVLLKENFAVMRHINVKWKLLGVPRGI
jgi:hypothetical protein